MQALLLKQPEKQILKKKQQKIDQKFIETNEAVKRGDKVIMKATRQVGIVTDFRGKKVIVRVGTIPITVALDDVTTVKEKAQEQGNEQNGAGAV